MLRLDRWRSRTVISTVDRSARELTETDMSATVPGNDGVSVLRPRGEVLAAVRLMYLGAALTALLGVLRALDPDAFEDALADSAGEVSGASMRGTYLFFLLIVAGLWLVVARGCR